MIQIYDKNNINFLNNGDMTLTPTYAVVTWELNGEFSLELRHPMDDYLQWYLIQNNAIIEVSTPETSRQHFRIYKIEKTDKEIIAYGRQRVQQDLLGMPLLDVRPTNKNGQDALDIILMNTGFYGKSDIEKINTAYYIRKNIMEALASDDEQSFINRWGGEIEYNYDSINILQRIGKDNNVTISDSKNIESITVSENFDDVILQITPVGFDGITTVEDRFDSPKIDQYPEPIRKKHWKVVRFEDIKYDLEDEDAYHTMEEAQEALKEKAMAEFTRNRVDVPVLSIEVNMVDLRNTEAYAGLQNLETIRGGDTVHVYQSEYAVNFNDLRCVRYEWDAITESMNSLTIGEVEKNYFTK